MAIPFQTLQLNNPSSNPGSMRYVSRETLFKEIGWDEFLDNNNYANTCAIRVSLAMLKSGLSLSNGSHRVLDGKLQGKRIEVNMRKLANRIEQSGQFAKAERYTQDIYAHVRGRSGIIAFFNIPGYSGGGHIDLLDGSAPNMRCESDCYHSQEVWFWPMR